MSYLTRIPPPDPERDPLRIIFEELRDLHQIAECLSLRLRRIEERLPHDCPPEGD
jgi:hypothetical protein